MIRSQWIDYSETDCKRLDEGWLFLLAFIHKGFHNVKCQLNWICRLILNIASNLCFCTWRRHRWSVVALHVNGDDSSKYLVAGIGHRSMFHDFEAPTKWPIHRRCQTYLRPRVISIHYLIFDPLLLLDPHSQYLQGDKSPSKAFVNYGEIQVSIKFMFNFLTSFETTYL